MENVIEAELAKQENAVQNGQCGPVGEMAQRYHLESDRLLGLLLKLDFEESNFVTYKDLQWGALKASIVRIKKRTL